MDQQGEIENIQWLEKDPFPYQQIRDIIDIAGECITYHGSISRRSDPAEKYIGRSKIPDADKDIVRDFTSGAFQRMDSLPKEVRDSYVKYWNILWDVCGYDQMTGIVGTDGPEPESREEVALRVYKDGSPFTLELITEGQILLQDGKYEELLKHCLDKELERAGILRVNFIPDMGSTYEAGLYMGYADGLVLMSQIGANREKV